MSRRLTIRGVPDDIGRRLETLKRMQGQSVSATVRELLTRAVGFEERRRRLARYATWEREDVEDFDRALAAQRTF